MNTWIFQSNPDQFDIDEYIKRENILFTIRQKVYIGSVKLGDIVYIWKSKGIAGFVEYVGIIAKGEVTGESDNYPDDGGKSLYTSEVHLEEAQKFKQVRIKILSRKILPKDDLEYDEILKKLSIISGFRNKTNFLLEPEEASKLNSAWSETPNLHNK